MLTDNNVDVNLPDADKTLSDVVAEVWAEEDKKSATQKVIEEEKEFYTGFLKDKNLLLNVLNETALLLGANPIPMQGPQAFSNIRAPDFIK